MKKATLISLVLAVTGFAAEPPAEVAITKGSVSTFYRQFQRLTKEPYRVPPAFAGLCASAPPPATYTHASPSIHIYANPQAADTIAQKRKVFPTGAVIVKEKLGDNGAVTGIGGMVKRAAGFDPKSGDWEWFYSEKASGFSIGKLQNCADCHANSKHTDYVISVWKLGKQTAAP